jgi:hypothetical protein
MTREQRKTLIAKRREAWEHAHRRYLIQCAKSSIDLAPLPEFKDALTTLEFYDESPSKKTRSDLMKVYRRLKAGRRDYGYTSVGCFYDGLVRIIYQAMNSKGESWSTASVYFPEAHYCAARNLHIPVDDVEMYLPDRAQRVVRDLCDKIWEEVWGAFHEKYGDTPAEFIQMKEAA